MASPILSIGYQRKETGNSGESMVCDYLLAKQYKILDRNKFMRTGEIDILAEKGGVTVIVEVKTVTADKFGQAIGYVNRKKQDKLRQLARELIQILGDDRNIRIDVAGVDFQSGEIDYIENAVTGK
ncbi:MAG: YraN family protein [Candidatus Berkelbacteria bacterium]